MASVSSVAAPDLSTALVQYIPEPPEGLLENERVQTPLKTTLTVINHTSKKFKFILAEDAVSQDYNLYRVIWNNNPLQLPNGQDMLIAADSITIDMPPNDKSHFVRFIACTNGQVTHLFIKPHSNIVYKHLPTMIFPNEKREVNEKARKIGMSLVHVLPAKRKVCLAAYNRFGVMAIKWSEGIAEWVCQTREANLKDDLKKFFIDIPGRFDLIFSEHLEELSAVSLDNFFTLEYSIKSPIVCKINREAAKVIFVELSHDS